MKKHRLQLEWENIIQERVKSLDWWTHKKKEYEKRKIKVLQITGDGQVFHKVKATRNSQDFTYNIHLNMLLKQNGKVFIEEQVIPFQLKLEGNDILAHEVKSVLANDTPKDERFVPDLEDMHDQNQHREFFYDRRRAVQYAERWWNNYNPAYHKFENDCTNYISQCLHAGGAPMWGNPNRSKGWWYSGTNWSYSWSVANAIRWYLSSASKGLTASEVERAEELMPGDIICYDFEGDGKWNHNTIVVAKDGYGEPLVNAHSINSRMRYWRYEDSPAWTSKCKYKFFRIG